MIITIVKNKFKKSEKIIWKEVKKRLVLRSLKRGEIESSLKRETRIGKQKNILKKIKKSLQEIKKVHNFASP